MATITLSRVIDLFPEGTTVTPYLVTNEVPVRRRTGAPRNATAGSTAAVSGGALTFSGLTPGRYIAYAQVSSQDRYLHFRVKEHSTSVNVTTSSTAILSANPSRRWLELVNNSDTDIYVELGSTATTSSAILLQSDGGSYSTSGYTGPVSAIHGGSGNKVLGAAEG